MESGNEDFCDPTHPSQAGFDKPSRKRSPGREFKQEVGEHRAKNSLLLQIGKNCESENPGGGLKCCVDKGVLSL
jgi:hypothetical protein